MCPRCTTRARRQQPLPSALQAGARQPLLGWATEWFRSRLSPKPTPVRPPRCTWWARGWAHAWLTCYRGFPGRRERRRVLPPRRVQVCVCVCVCVCACVAQVLVHGRELALKGTSSPDVTPQRVPAAQPAGSGAHRHVRRRPSAHVHGRHLPRLVPGCSASRGCHTGARARGDPLECSARDPSRGPGADIVLCAE